MQCLSQNRRQKLSIQKRTVPEKGRQYTKILKLNDQKGPIIVHLDKREWGIVQDEFRKSECGRNLPNG